MGKSTEIITYQQHDITNIIRLMTELSNRQDAMFFYTFAKNYGTRNICQILNNRGFEMYGITLTNGVDVVDKISKNMISKVSNKRYINSLLYSPYYYSKYVQNQATLAMEEQKIWFAYNTLVDNSKVDIKKRYSIDGLSNLVNNGDVILLGLKEKQITADSLFFEGLTRVDKDYLAKAQNGFIEKNIFPSVKFADCNSICQNLQQFEKRFPKLKQEMISVNKKIAQKVLQYEVQNQQILLSNTLEKGQEQFKYIVEEYQRKAGKIQNLMALNQKLLTALGDKPLANDYQFEANDNVEKPKILKTA